MIFTVFQVIGSLWSYRVFIPVFIENINSEISEVEKLTSQINFRKSF